MSLPLNFPSTLPQPSIITQARVDTRLNSSIADGPPQTRQISKDFKGAETLQWFFDATTAAIFLSFWETALLKGGRWFTANWPRINAGFTVCRFLAKPSWRLVGHEFWEVNVNAAIRGISMPPLKTALVLGAHFDGDYADAAGGSLNPVVGIYTIGGQVPAPFTAPGKFAATSVAFNSYATAAVYSDDRASLALNEFGEWQISVFLKPQYNGVYSYSGGGVLDMLSWGHPDGGAALAIAPDEPKGQFRFRVTGDASDADITFDYPALNPTTGNVDLVRLELVGVGGGAVPSIPVDGNFHHIGIAGDATSSRMYVDGNLVADDNDLSIGRPAGQRPMFVSSSYVDQRFLVGALFAGTFSGDYGPTFPYDMAVTIPFAGKMSDLYVACGVGSVTFVGPSITVPVAPFVR